MRKSLKWLIIYSQTHEFNSKSNTSHVISQLADQVKVVAGVFGSFPKNIVKRKLFVKAFAIAIC